MPTYVDADRLLRPEVIEAAAEAGVQWDPYEQAEVPAVTVRQAEAILRRAVELVRGG